MDSQPHSIPRSRRDRLLNEIQDITSADLAASWAHAALAAKNTLVATDAGRVEEAFEQKVSTLVPSDSLERSSTDPSPHVTSASTEPGTLPIPKPRRYRNKDHLRYVARQACLICGRQPSDPHHLCYAQPRALGKASDEFTVPLCRVHHREVHRIGNEAAWWQAAGIDPLSVAQVLWNRTRVTEGHISPDERPARAPKVTSTDLSSHQVDRVPKKRGKRVSSRSLAPPA